MEESDGKRERERGREGEGGGQWAGKRPKTCGDPEAQRDFVF
jgi:hypothetical protein